MNKSHNDGYSIYEFLSTLKANARLLVFVFLSVIIISIGYFFIQTPIYITTTSILVEPLYNLEMTSGSKRLDLDISYELQYLDNQSTIIRTLDMIDLTSFFNRDGSDYSDLLRNKKKLKSLIKNLEISRVPNTNVVNLSLKHPNREFSKIFLATISDVFSMKLLELSNKQLDKEYYLLQDRLRETEENLERITITRDEFQSTPISIEAISNRGNYERILSFIDIRIREVEPFSKGANTSSLLETLNLNDSKTINLVTAYSNAYRKFLFNEILRLVNPAKANIIESKENSVSFYREELDNQMIALLNHLASLTETTETDEILLHITSTAEYLILIEEKQFYLNKVAVYKSIDILGEQINVELSKYKRMLNQYIDEIDSFESYRSIIVDPTFIVEPLRIRDENGKTNAVFIIIFGIMSGILLVVFIVFFYESCSDSIDDDLFIKRIVRDEIPVWACVPKKKNNNYSSFKSLNRYKDYTSEAFKQLATILQYQKTSINKNLYCFSSLEYEEATLPTVLNLAQTMTKTGRKVLVIGANIEEADYNGIYTSVTNSNKLVKKVLWEKIEKVELINFNSKQPTLHLSYISLKDKELSLYLNSTEFDNLTLMLAGSYDYILIDGPTFRYPSDLFTVAKASGGLFLIIRQGIASKKAFQELLETTYYAQVPIRGIVFNAMFGMPSFKEKRRIRKQNLS